MSYIKETDHESDISDLCAVDAVAVVKDDLERLLDFRNFFREEFPDLIPAEDVEGRPHVLVLEGLPLPLGYRRVVQGSVADNLS